MPDPDESPVAALIGDVVGSRRAPDRRALHRSLVATLEDVNQQLRPVEPLRITVGDEYQAAFRTLGAAAEAAFMLRLALLPAVDVRHGIGWGATAVLGVAPRVEDGPGWWAARHAIEAVAEVSVKPAFRALRTRVAVGDGEQRPEVDALNAALMCRDHMTSRLSPRSLHVLRRLLDGWSQADIAREAAVSASAISKRIRVDGLLVLIEASATVARTQTAA